MGTEYFVDKQSVVRQIWGKSDTILFFFAGTSAEFALNKAVEWLYRPACRYPNMENGRYTHTSCQPGCPVPRNDIILTPIQVFSPAAPDAYLYSINLKQCKPILDARCKKGSGIWWVSSLPAGLWQKSGCM